MPNHVHLVLVPGEEDGLRAVLGEAHRRYTRFINFREGWRGHLRQERFHSFVMDEHCIMATVRYVERNPVVANPVAHRSSGAGPLPKPISMKKMISWSGSNRCWIGSTTGILALRAQKQPRLMKNSFKIIHAQAGHLDSETFVSELERLRVKPLAPRKPKPPAKRNR